MLGLRCTSSPRTSGKRFHQIVNKYTVQPASCLRKQSSDDVNHNNLYCKNFQNLICTSCQMRIQAYSPILTPTTTTILLISAGVVSPPLI